MVPTLVAIVLAGCVSATGGPGSPGSTAAGSPAAPGAVAAASEAPVIAATGSSPATTPTPAPTPPVPVRVGQALVTDQPCTRVGGDLASLAPVALHHEDLERMVLRKADLPGFAGYQEGIRWGFADNPEVQSLTVNGAGTCDQQVRFGRLEGFAADYDVDETGTRNLLSAVHLFWDADGATGWMRAYLDSFAPGERGPGAGYTFTTVQPATAPDDILLVQHVGPDGTRTWAWFQRGPIVGWVIDLHPAGVQPIDVAAAAGRMAARVQAVLDDAAARPRQGLDVAQLISAPLPKAAYGARADGLRWDEVFGGCTDTLEVGFISGDAAAFDARRFGRLAGCTAMFDPGGVPRLFSGVGVYGEAQNASAAMAAGLAELKDRGGHPFAVPPLGDEAIGFVTPPSGDVAFTDTRVLVRFGPLVARVVLQDPANRQSTADAVRLARELAARVATLLASNR